MPRSRTGARTMPKSKFCDVSGVSLLFPPVTPSPWVMQVALVNGAIALAPLAGGQSGFPCPMVPLVEAAMEFGEYKSLSVGARKPVEAVPLTVRKRAG